MCISTLTLLLFLALTTLYHIVSAPQSNMSEECILWCCGDHDGRSVKEKLREVMRFEFEPVELVVSSVWDACHVYAEWKSADSLACRAVFTTGRWAQLRMPGELLSHNESIVRYCEIANRLLLHTNQGRILAGSLDKDVNVMKLSNLPAPLDRLISVQGSSKLYARLTNGHVHLCRLNSECILELCCPVLAGLVIKQVCCGSDHVLFLGDGSGRVWSSGLNHRGQLGHGDLNTRTEPVVVEALDGVGCVAVACGLWHSLALSQYGDVYSWGWNADRQLGHSVDSATVAVPKLVDVDEDKNFKAVSCGSRHSAALTLCGELFTWGWNAYGQLGHSVSSGPAQVGQPAAGAVVAWMHCQPWSTLLIMHTAH